MVVPLERFKSWLDGLTSPSSAGIEGNDADIERQRVNARVISILLVEIARSNHEVDEKELDAIASSLGHSTNLDRTEIESLLEAALAEADSAVSLHEHVRLMNEQLDKPAKIELIEAMWRVAVADGRIDHHEEYTVRKLSDLLHVKHRDFMQAKLRVLDGVEQ